MICEKCDGTGSYKNYGECFECRGFGVMAKVVSPGIIEFNGVRYKTGDVIFFRTTASKIEQGIIAAFKHKDNKLLLGDQDLNNIWMDVISKRTGKNNYYPLHLSIKLKQAVNEKG